MAAKVDFHIESTLPNELYVCSSGTVIHKYSLDVMWH